MLSKVPHQYRCLQNYQKQVDHLLDLKKAHQKAVKKKQERQAKKAVSIWKKRTWTLSRTSSRIDTPAISPTTTTIPVDDTDADDEHDDEDDAVSPTERNDSMPDVSPPSPPHPLSPSISSIHN